MPWTDAQECAMQLCGRDVLVSAAAGSGKTATLTERILRSLTAKDEEERGDISRMLIVTFTRAAAAELRSRISKKLSDAIATCEDDDMRKKLNDQLLKLGSAQISTIDSFYQDVVRTNFDRLGLPAGFRLVEDSELQPLKERILSHIIEEGYRLARKAEDEPDAPLDSLADNAFADAMDDVVANRDRGNLAEILLKLYDRLLTYPDELKLLKASADRMEREAALPITQTATGQKLLDIFLPALLCVRDELRAAPEILKRAPTTEKFLSIFIHDLETIERVIVALENDDWDAARSLILTYRPAGNLTNAGKAGKEPDYRQCKAARDTAKHLLTEALPKYFESDAATCKKHMLRTAQTQRLLYDILSRFDQRIGEEKRRRAAFEFTDIRRFMLRLLEDEEGNATDIARALSNRYTAVYIDEYQDVDAVQDRIFMHIGKGGKRFMVGDIKQSIYGFRGSDPSRFKRYKDDFPAVLCAIGDPNLSPDGNRVAMSQNFRCDRSVIQFTNNVCSYVFEVCPDALNYLPSEDDLVKGKEDKNCLGKPVHVVMLRDPSNAQKSAPEGTLDAEALYISDEIARLLHGGYMAEKKRKLCAKDIAILTRSEIGAEQLVKALMRYNIPTTFAPRVNLASDPQMTMMVSLLSVIDNPHDDMPLMGLLAAQGSPITLADVLTVRNLEGAGSLYDDLRDAVAQGTADLSAPTLQSLRALFKQLDEWRSLASVLPIDKLLRHIYAHPSLAPIANSPALLAIYDHARNFQSASFCGLYQFLQYFRRVLEKPSELSAAGLKEQENAVKIMTIHKSKGLEFPVVFLYKCAKQFNTMDEREAMVFDPELGVATKQYVPETVSMTSTLTREVIIRRMHERAHEEEMRILYVALTRARERLYVTATVSKNAIENASSPTRGNRYAILSASNSFAWILSALTEPNCRGPLDASVVNITTTDVAEILAKADEPLTEFPEPEAPLVTDEAEQTAVTPDTEQVESTDNTEKKKNNDDEETDEERTLKIAQDGDFYRSVLEQHRTYVDTHAVVRRLPTKAAASKLRAAMLDEIWLPDELGSDTNGQKSRDGEAMGDTRAYIKSRIELMRRAERPFDSWVKESQHSAAEKGTATHLFLQHCNFARLARDGVDAELALLTAENGPLPRRVLDLVHRDQLEAFCRSDLFSHLTKTNARYWRELHFDRFIPYAHLTRNPALVQALEDYKLYVQGSLDLLIKDEDGKLWLCDYKTDRIHADTEEGIRRQLLDAHADQLRIYAEAVEGLFGHRPDHIVIYSLPLGRHVELTKDL